MAKKPMTENARKVLEFLQSAGPGVKFTAKQVQTELGFEKVGSVTGTVTGLVNKKLADHFEETYTDENGKEKVIKYFALNDAGMAYDPEAAAAEEE